MIYQGDRGNRMQLEELINKNYSQLNENDLYIWKYISTHRKECENISINQLADYCHVSRTTILRFSKRLGLKGFTELKVLLKIDNNISKYYLDGVDTLYKTYSQYLEDIKNKDMIHVIESMISAKNIYACGTGSVQNHVVSEMKRSFLEVGRMIYSIRSLADEINAFEEVIDKDDFVILVSHSGENEKIISFAKKLKAKGVQTMAITSKKNNTLLQIVDYPFYVVVPTIANPLGPRHEGLVSYFLLIDFLLVKYLDYYERIKI